MANAGAGTQSHLAGVSLARAPGIDVIHAPYKGGGASVATVIAGESHVTITPAPAVMARVRAGRLRALASGGAKR
jgi:tripartite-type tricarboxylate transporter receptor subunit TctC